jgi:hypothetical protein
VTELLEARQRAYALDATATCTLSRVGLDEGPCHADGDGVEFPVELSGRVVPEQIVRTEIGEQSRQAGREVVAVERGESVGTLGQRLQRLPAGTKQSGVEIRVLRREKAGHLRPRPKGQRSRDRLVEDGQAARNRWDRTKRWPCWHIPSRCAVVIQKDDGDAGARILRDRAGFLEVQGGRNRLPGRRLTRRDRDVFEFLDRRRSIRSIRLKARSPCR